MTAAMQHSLIIGGTRGIGLAAAKAYAAEGGPVSVIARHPPAADAVVADVDYWQSDIADAVGLAKTLAAVAGRGGPLHRVLMFQRFRGAGDTWDGEIATSLAGTRNVIELAAELFTAGAGAIAIVSSVNATLITPRLPVSYHLAKAGLNQLVRYYAVTLGPRGIRLNSVSPGTVLKEESEHVYLGDADLQALYRRMVPLGRMGRADEVVQTVRFLCSDAASFITGQDLVVDGGLSLQWHEALIRNVLAATPKKQD